MKNYLVPGLFVAMVVLFFVGRWTAPQPVDDHAREINSLKRANVQLLKLKRMAEDSMWYFRTRADHYFAKAVQEEKEKLANKKKYEGDLVRIDRLTPSGVDSALFARYGRLYADSLGGLPKGRP